jgi:hypothetical protein
MKKKFKAEDGSSISVDDSTPVDCPVHNIHTTWGALDPIQQLAVESGLDTTTDLPCILEPRKTS